MFLPLYRPKLAQLVSKYRAEDHLFGLSSRLGFYVGVIAGMNDSLVKVPKLSSILRSVRI
jgi:hypothetical protein